MEGRKVAGLSESGGGGLVQDLAPRIEDIAFNIRSFEVDRAIMWTTYASGADAMDPDWSRPRLRTLWDLKAHNTRFVPDPIFQTLRRQLLRQWRLVEAIPQKHVQLVPLHRYEFPNQGDDNFRYHAPVVFVKNLVFGGSSAIVQGPKGSGKTGFGVWIVEQLNAFKEEYKVKESGSTLSWVMGQQGRADFKEKTDRKKRIGLANSDDFRVIANFSIYDDTGPKGETIPSPIRGKHIRIESAHSYLDATADCIYGPGGKYYYSAFIYDEAGVGYSRIRSTSRKNKTTQDMGRMTGKAGQTWIFMTHKEEVDLPDDVVEAATTKVAMLLPSGASEPPRSGATGIFTIAGSTIRNTRLRQIPLPISSYDTNETPAFDIDVDFEGALAYIATEQGDAERNKQEWGRKQRATAMKEAASKFRISKQLMAAGKSPAQIAEVRFLLRTMPTNRATGKPWTDAEIADMTEADPAVVGEVRKQFEKEQRDRAETKPPLPA